MLRPRVVVKTVVRHSVGMEEQQRTAATSVTQFSAELSRLQERLEPLLSALETLRATPVATLDSEVDPLSRARLHITLCYTINSLFCMYLRTQGVDPLTHPVAERITNVQDAFLRLRRVEAGDHDSPNHGRPKRNYRESVAKAHIAAEQLAAVVFPEEAELIKALRNTRKRMRFDTEEDDGGGDSEASNEAAKGQDARKARRSRKSASSNSNESDGDDVPNGKEERAANGHDDTPASKAESEGKPKKKRKRNKKKSSGGDEQKHKETDMDEGKVNIHIKSEEDTHALKKDKKRKKEKSKSTSSQ